MKNFDTGLTTVTILLLSDQSNQVSDLNTSIKLQFF